MPETTHDISRRCLAYLQLKMGLHCKIEMHISTSNELGCWGMAWPHDTKRNTYCISVAEDQSLRNFIATIAHELIHVRQWVHDKYMGDGEEEAKEDQFKWADEIWNEGVV